MDAHDSDGVSLDGGMSRRSVLRASGGAVGFSGVGFTTDGRDRLGFGRRCPDATLRPSMVHYEHGGMDGCADDHPRTKELQAEVKDSLESNYPTVGALIDDGFVPYFDLASADGEAAWSHWLNPSYLGDDTILDPERPESVLVDHRWWRPMGVMFVASRDGHRVDSPPVIYGDDSADGACNPWHAHAGFPSRYAWWKYRLLYVDGVENGMRRLPCRTPWVMHVWAFPHPRSIYAHSAPPRGSRGGPPAEPAGFETDAVPGEDDLDWTVLPDALRHRVKHR